MVLDKFLSIKMLAVALAMLVALAGIGAFFVYTSQPAVAASGLTAEDIKIESADGEVKSLYMKPDLNISWENMGSKVAKVKIRFKVTGPNNANTMNWHTKTINDTARSGSTHFQMDKIQLLQKNNGPLKEKSFEVSEDNTTKETPVNIRVDVKLIDSNGDTIYKEKGITSTPFNVVVTNKKSEVTVSGQLNTGGKPTCIGSTGIVNELKELLNAC